MINLTIKSSAKKEIIDITDEIQNIIRKENASERVCKIFVLHTTCALTTGDLDPETDKDYLTAIEKMFPRGNYFHPHNPEHVGDHIMSSIVGNSVSIPVEKGKLSLGTWQRIILIELNGPRERRLKISL